jgi:hypothetical protein
MRKNFLINTIHLFVFFPINVFYNFNLNILTFLALQTKEMIQQIILAIILVFLVKQLKQLWEFIQDIQYKRRLTKEMAGPEHLPLIGCIHKAPLDSHRLFSLFILCNKH